MNQSQALSQGLECTGIYERYWNKDEVKARAAAIRKEYKCRAVVVEEDGGYSVYAGEIYRLTNTIKRLESRTKDYPNRERRLKQKFDDDMNGLKREELKTKHTLDEYKIKLKDARKNPRKLT